jgi:hypothetical protein
MVAFAGDGIFWSFALALERAASATPCGTSATGASLGVDEGSAAQAVDKGSRRRWTPGRLLASLRRTDARSLPKSSRPAPARSNTCGVAGWD